MHTAAQPSHDRAAGIPFDDFDTNAVGTLNLLEATRQFAAESLLVHMSTNKVYGDGKHLDSRKDPMGILTTKYKNGISENFSIDRAHSLFGASKVAADVIVQEYGRAISISVCCLRGGAASLAPTTQVSNSGFTRLPNKMLIWKDDSTTSLATKEASTRQPLA